MEKQLIIARRDLNMSPGKLAAQVSSAFLIEMITGLTTESPRQYVLESNIIRKLITPVFIVETRIPQYSVTPKDNVTILNFASYKKPRKKAQLYSQLLPTYYAWNNISKQSVILYGF